MTAALSQLPYGQHRVDEDDIEAVVEVLRGDWLTGGPKVGAFEGKLADTTNARHAVAVSSGTAALHLASMALGVGEGDAVIVPAITFLATANAARYCGADVVFADVDADTGLMGVREFEAAVARAQQKGYRPTAVFPVHLAGQCRDPEGVLAAARERGMVVLEDACHAVGTAYGGEGAEFQVGACAHADMAALSFHPVKTIAMGEGGAITTNDAEAADRLRSLRNHGTTRDPAQFHNRAAGFEPDGNPCAWYYEMHELGFNYRASDIHCSLGLNQLSKLTRRASRRAELWHHYSARLSKHAPLVRPLERVPACTPCWHLFVALIDFQATGLTRSEVMRRLGERGVGTQVHYIPVYTQPYYQARYGRTSLPGAAEYYERSLSLPLFPHMADEDVDRVVDELELVLSLR